MLEVDAWPKLDRPVMLIALTGWVDAGFAGAGALGTVAEQLQAARRFGTIDLADLSDLQQTRPIATLVGGVTREITWPQVELVAGAAGRDVVVVAGPEPSIRWRGFAEALAGAAKTLDVRLACTLGGMPVAASHRRPIAILSTATSRSLAQEAEALRTDYLGPTGAQTVVQVALGQAGIPTVGLWAEVPHYVAASPSPPAVRALLERLRDVAGIAVDLRDLDSRCDEYHERVEAGLEDRPDVAELVRRMEEAADDTDLPSGEELAREIERFLREER